MGRSSEEDDVRDTTPALDEAFERMAAASFELPNGFVNHGAMACEALAMLDCTGDIDSWARRFARAGGASVDPVVPAGFEWRQALGDYHLLNARSRHADRPLLAAFACPLIRDVHRIGPIACRAPRVGARGSGLKRASQRGR
jgi:hypothetical protein